MRSDRRNEPGIIEHIPFSQKIYWGMGGLTASMVNAVMIMAMPIYSLGFGVSAFWIGIALAVPRFVDAVFDPIIGYISDETRSRWGRRRPYILVGGILLGLFFWLLWAPPRSLGPNGMLIWFTAFNIAYFTFFSIWNVPWTALGFELTPDPKERTSVQVYRSAMATGTTFLVPLMLPLSFAWGGGDETKGVFWVGLLFGGIMTLFAIPGFFCRERFQTSSKPRTSFIQSLIASLRYRPFALLCGYTTLYVAGILAVSQMGYYINVFHVFGELEFQEAKVAAGNISFWTGIVGAVAGLAILPFLAPMAARIGKKNTLLGGAVAVLLSQALTWFCFSPSHPWLQVILQLLFAPASSLIWCIIPSMIADICDLDELQSGERREGMFGAIWYTLLKLGAALAMAVSGLLISLGGIVDGVAKQSPEAVLNARLVFAILPMACVAIGAFFILKYSITERDAEEAREQLSRKRLQADS
jgi:GPH family glycoside/pentoside/hexuronide:cation symporter